MSEEFATAENKNKKAMPRRSYVPYTAMTLDADYRVCTYGDMSFGLFGYPEVSMLGKPVSKIIPGLAPHLEKHAGPKASRIDFNEVRMEAVHSDGKSIPVMVALRQNCLHGTCRHLVLIRNLESRPQA